MSSHEPTDNAIRSGDPRLTRVIPEENAIRAGDPPLQPTPAPPNLAASTLFGHTMLFLVVYVFGSGALIYANTTWFGLGDLKFGAGGWIFYWPIWVVFFAPIALAAVVVTWCFRFPGLKGIAFIWICLLATLASLEISFVSDVKLPGLFMEWILLPIAFVLLAGVARSWRET